MDETDFPTPNADVESVSPSALKERIDAGEDVLLLDTRMESAYEEWRVDGETVESINVPYFEFLDEEIDGSVLAQIPGDREITVLCAKGGSSEYVAAALEERGYDVDHLEGGMNGWARIYERVEVERYDGSGTLYQYQRPSNGCLGYLLVDGDEAAVIDPLRAFADRYLADAAELGSASPASQARQDAEDLGTELKYAIDTHVHADHISGVRELADEGVEGVVPEASVDRGVTYADEMTLAADGGEFRVGGSTIEAVYTPGHTSGMTSYLIDGSLLATGDGLFVESVARPDLEEGAARRAADSRAAGSFETASPSRDDGSRDAASEPPRDGDEGAEDAARQLYESLQERVLALSDDTLIGGAHVSDAAEPAADGTYTAPIGQLEAEMDALTMDEDAFVELVLSDIPPRPANYEGIIATNLGQREADDDEAFELGPNNCATSQESLAGD